MNHVIHYVERVDEVASDQQVDRKAERTHGIQGLSNQEGTHERGSH
jgi:hypothetical protein